MLFVIALLGFLLISNCAFTVETIGDSEIVMTYGGPYVDEGAYAYLTIPFLGNITVDEHLEADGEVDPDVVGTYNLIYRAECLWRRAGTVRRVRVVDQDKPIIILTEDPDSFTSPGQEYVEEGFTAEDKYDGDLTSKVVRKAAKYTVTYTVSDSSGNTTQVERRIKYKDVTAPELKLLGGDTLTMKAGATYTDPGYLAVDDLDGDISDKVQVSGEFTPYLAGTYTLEYRVTDGHGNTTVKTRTVIVEPLKQPDVVNPSGKVIYLTFDDGPSVHTRRLLNILEKYNVRATFFVTDNGYTHLLPEITRAGHSIGMHTATHEYSEVYASESAYFKDLHRIESVIYKKTGIKSTLMRFPGGSSNRVSEKYCKGIMTRLKKAVVDQGYQYFDWNVNAADAEDAKDKNTVFQNVINGIQGKKIAVVLQHDIYGFSVDAVDMIIQWGLANGYVFLPLEPTSPTCHHS